VGGAVVVPPVPPVPCTEPPAPEELLELDEDVDVAPPAPLEISVLQAVSVRADAVTAKKANLIVSSDARIQGVLRALTGTSAR
jgi:hypothetical protein